MPLLPPIEYDDATPEVRAVYYAIRAARNTDYINSFWKVLANDPATLRQAALTGWCGMRGLVTLATAFALPADFPQRDIVVLAAFAVVLATLVAQGLTLVPLINWLGLDRRDESMRELVKSRALIAKAGLTRLDRAGPSDGSAPQRGHPQGPSDGSR